MAINAKSACQEDGKEQQNNNASQWKEGHDDKN